MILMNLFSPIISPVPIFLLLLMLHPIISISTQPSNITIPHPNGTHGVSLTNHEFIQHNRTDPYTYKAYRKLIISLIEPIGPISSCQPVRQKYIPNTTAFFWEQQYFLDYNISLTGTFSNTYLDLCHHLPKNKTTKEDEDQYPIVFFSPGSGTPRQFYSILGTNIAAQGFRVVLLDVPGEDNIVTFLDGVVEYGDPLITEIQELDMDIQEALFDLRDQVRVDDAMFILDWLLRRWGYDNGTMMGDSSASSSLPPVMIFGHSLGGDTAAEVMEADDRFVGGCNLDGALRGKPLNQTSDKPFLILGHAGHNQTGAEGWTQVWNNLLGPKWQLELDNSTHDTFTDVPIIAEMFGLYEHIPAVTELLGTIDPYESLKIQSSILSTLAGYLGGQKNVESVLQVAESFPEVVVYDSSDVGN